MDIREYFTKHPGSQLALAKLLNVTLVMGRRPVPIKYCLQIERYTEGKVTRRDLRPNDFAQIWPELAA